MEARLGVGDEVERRRRALTAGSAGDIDLADRFADLRSSKRTARFQRSRCTVRPAHQFAAEGEVRIVEGFGEEGRSLVERVEGEIGPPDV